MNFILLFVLGFSVSFAGTIPPSMLNMTAAKISIDSDKHNALKFAFGVSIIVFLQAYIALFFTEYIHNNEKFTSYISIIAIIIFFLLSIYFFKQAKREKRTTEPSYQKSKNSFLFGLTLSSLNMFAIPFYCWVASVFNSFGWLDFNNLNITLFVIGSSLGTFMLLYTYVNAAQRIRRSVKLMNKNLNYVLGVLTALIAIITFIRII